MKIGFVLDDSLDSSDGVQQYILTLGQWMQQQGHEVHYLVGQTKRHDLPHIHSLSRNIAVSFNGNRMSMPLPASKSDIQRLLAAEQFDVLHVQMPYSPFLAAKIIKAAPPSTVFVGTFHILPIGNLQRFGARALQFYVRGSASRLKKVWSVSEPAQQFASSLGIKSDVLPNVIDLGRFGSGRGHRSKDSFVVTFLGRLVPRKGCAELLRAVQILTQNKAIPNLKIRIGGKGPQLHKLQQLVVQNSLQDVVSFEGYIDEQQKPDFLAAADVAVFPSLGGESFGIVLLEAMAARSGVVIGGNNAGYSSVLASAPKSLFDPAKPAELAKLLQKLHEDREFFNNLHARQQTLVQDYDVAVIGKKLLSYYQELKKSHETT